MALLLRRTPRALAALATRSATPTPTHLSHCRVLRLQLLSAPSAVSWRAYSGRKGGRNAVNSNSNSSNSNSSSSSNVSRLRGTPHLKRKLGQHLLVSDDILDRTVAAAELPALIESKKQQHKSSEVTLRVLEIGPGTGNLTSALLQAAPGVHVHAVEFDARMVERLQERFGGQDGDVQAVGALANDGDDDEDEEDDDSDSDSDSDDSDSDDDSDSGSEDDDEEDFEFDDDDDEEDDEALVTRISDRLTVEQADFEQFEFFKEAEADADGAPLFFDACVANIPYQLSSIIVSRLTTYMHRYPSRMRCAVLLVQEEFARRLLAKPGEQTYSRLSVNTALIADVESVAPVPRNLFLPPPKVDSRVIKLTPRLDPALYALADLPRPTNSLLRQFPALTDDPLFFQRFDALLRVCFLRKNKTLRALLTSRTARVVYELDAERLPFANGHDTSNEDARVTAACEAALAACALSTSRAVQVPVAQFLMLQHELQTRGVALRPSDTRHFRD